MKILSGAKPFLAALAVAATFGSAAWAGEAEGFIQSVDTSTNTMVLDDGQTYVLPADFDISLIGAGMRVALAFDENGDSKRVTDMEQVD